MTSIKAGVAGIALATIAGCANFGNPYQSRLSLVRRSSCQIPLTNGSSTAQHKAELAAFWKTCVRRQVREAT